MPEQQAEQVHRVILWRRLDKPGHEAARVLSRGSEWHLRGTAIFLQAEHPCRLHYSVVCNSHWQTVSATVEGWIGSQAVQIELVADASRWERNGVACPAVDGCTDVDFGFSPSTNLLPIRRLSLAIGQESPVRAAWLRFPECTLEPLEQKYTRLDEHLYCYQSAGGRFVAELQVDDVGLVTHYPKFFEEQGG